jgi:predicted enzyme related to lactoylglutathione lyase
MPTLRNGKICHVELPASDPAASASFYQRVFGWKVHRHGLALAFDDPTGEVSGHWVPERPTASPGVLIYIWVDDINRAIDAVVDAGCQLIQPVGGDSGELTARFIDPGGNVVGLYQEPESPAD